MVTRAVRLKQTTYSIILGIIGLLLVSASFFMPSAHALTLDAHRDCDTNGVIRCGALSTEELIQKYNSQPDVRAIFNQFGISPQDIGNIGSTAVSGMVYRDGKITVNNRIVATHAMTAGRQNISGSTPVNSGGSQFYTRPPSVSFQTKRLKAFVVMSHNNKFAFAILASCGNPVKAKPVQVHRPTPPAPVKPKRPQPKPRPQTVPQQQQQQQQSQSQSITVNQTPPQPPTPQPETKTIVEKVSVPVPTVVQQPTVTTPTTPTAELPKTGIDTVGGTLGIAGLATLGTTGLHFLYARRKA